MDWFPSAQPQASKSIYGRHRLSGDGSLTHRRLTAIQQPLATAGDGGVFLAESLSVIIQVWVFKATKQADGTGHRVFRMSPLHHHFELGGMPEESVVGLFWIVNTVLILLGIAFRPF